MKCKNCGGEIRLEDLYCPYCGSPNEESIKHARDMQHYQNEFRQTKEDVIDRADRQSRSAVRIAVTAFLLLAIGVNIFLQANSYSIHRMWEEMQAKGNEDQYRQRIESFLEEEDYVGLSAYCLPRVPCGQSIPICLRTDHESDQSRKIFQSGKLYEICFTVCSGVL